MKIRTAGFQSKGLLTSPGDVAGFIEGIRYPAITVRWRGYAVVAALLVALLPSAPAADLT